MSVPIISSLPVFSRWVPGCLETLIDKKVAGIALNIFERALDGFFSWLYCPYRPLFLAKMARVHLFSDGVTKLYDLTKKAVASLEFEWNKDFIALHRRKVLFTRDPHIEMIFSQGTNTDYVLVKEDDRRRPGWYQIIEQERGFPRPMEKIWHVNTNQLAMGNAYLVEPPRLIH